MKKYIAYYHHKDGDICNAYFNANNIKDAKSFAQFHKRKNNELKYTKTEVRLLKNN